MWNQCININYETCAILLTHKNLSAMLQLKMIIFSISVNLKMIIFSISMNILLVFEINNKKNMDYNKINHPITIDYNISSKLVMYFILYSVQQHKIHQTYK